MTTEADLRASICAVGRSLFERGYVHSSAGNISARLGDGFLITPTDACLGELASDDLARVDTAGQQLSGLKASKTIHLHRAIYAACPAARCVLHTHSAHLVALSIQGVWHPDCVLPPLTPYMVMKVGEVPLIPYRLPGSSDVGAMVQTHLRARPATRGVMLERLGPVVWGSSPRDASNVLEELEETAHLWLMTGRQAALLSDADVQALCERFGVTWCRTTAP